MLTSAKDKVDEFFRPYLLCSENIDVRDEQFLSESFSLIKLPPFDMLDSPVASHADMLICALGDLLVTHELYYKKNKDLFDLAGLKAFTVNEPVSKRYPDDIVLNGLFLSGDLYGRTDKLAKFLCLSAKKTVHVNQGYARCSVCKISEDAIITADPSIARAAEENGVDVLKITPGHVLLDGYGYGFIGGASFFHGDTLYFFGRIEDHPDYAEIKDFASKHSVKLVSVSDHTLSDIGGAVVYER